MVFAVTTSYVVANRILIRTSQMKNQRGIRYAALCKYFLKKHLVSLLLNQSLDICIAPCVNFSCGESVGVGSPSCPLNGNVAKKVCCSLFHFKLFSSNTLNCSLKFEVWKCFLASFIFKKNYFLEISRNRIQQLATANLWEVVGISRVVRLILYAWIDLTCFWWIREIIVECLSRYRFSRSPLIGLEFSTSQLKVLGMQSFCSIRVVLSHTCPAKNLRL